MDNLWREMGFITQRRPKVNLKFERVKKRLKKATKKFKEDRRKLMELQLRNHIKKLVIKELEKKLDRTKARWRDKKGLQNMKSFKAIE